MNITIIIVSVIIVLLLLLFIVSYIKAGPDTAIMVSGLGKGKF